MFEARSAKVFSNLHVPFACRTWQAKLSFITAQSHLLSGKKDIIQLFKNI